MPAKPPTLYWNPAATPQPLHAMLRTLGAAYPLVEKPRRGAVAMHLMPGAPAGSVTVQLDKTGAAITYDQPIHALRGVGSLLAGLVRRTEPLVESMPFATFGIMLDCSRNAVMTVAHLQKWLRQLALLGYNMVMLYTEDTYQVPGEPCFGYLRGRYTAEELRAIDQYAADLGIQVIGCIQTLGHLEQILKWPAYGKVRDTSSVVLGREDATYELIDKMIGVMADTCRSRRIHIGMDETHDLGRGQFLDRFGFQRGFDIFNQHLARVVELCKRRGLAPMIWSDMYFRMGSKAHNYYDTEVDIPADVKAAIPAEAQLVYWDYYHDNTEFYVDHIQRHRQLHGEPLMASGVWTWSRLWHDSDKTRRTALPCLAACRKQKVNEFFFTLWGDDGAYCEFDSALAGLALGAEAAYRGDAVVTANLARRFAAVCGGDYALIEKMSDLTRHDSPAILWDDPLLGIWWKARAAEDGKHWPKVLRDYQRLLTKVHSGAKITRPIDIAHGVNLLRCLIAKLDIGLKLHQAYRQRDKAGLAAVRRQVPAMVRAIDDLLASFRRQWHRRNKPEGFEVIQIRLAGLRQRYLELGQRLGELAAGKIANIPELEQSAGKTHRGFNWRRLASASDIV
ncbi:MAG: family 20 glycosylhydrolase [Phycisphaeraceae bacterium]